MGISPTIRSKGKASFGHDIPSVFSTYHGIKAEKFVPPTERRDIAGEFDSSNDGTEGPILISVPNHNHDFNNRVIEVSKEFPEFSYNKDINSGHPLGLGN